MMPNIHLEVRSAFPYLRPLASLPLSPRVTAISITENDSGAASCRIGYSIPLPGGGSIAAYLPEPVFVEDGAVIRVTNGADVLFLGVVTDTNEGSISAEGLGIWAMRWAQINAGGSERVSMGTIVGNGFESCPWLRLAELVDTNVLHAPSELHKRTLGDAINQMLSEGGIPDGQTDSVPWMCLVTDDPASELGLVRIVPKLPATEPDHTFSFDRDTMDVTWKLDGVDAVSVVYTENGKQRETPRVYRGGVDPTSRWLRTETLTGQASTNGAIQVAQTFLSQHSEPQLTGTISLSDWRGLNHKPGKTISMLGMSRSGDARAIASQCQHDLFSGVTQIQLGEPSIRTYAGFSREMQRVAHSVRRGRNIVTGATA